MIPVRLRFERIRQLRKYRGQPELDAAAPGQLQAARLPTMGTVAALFLSFPPLAQPLTSLVSPGTATGK